MEPGTRTGARRRVWCETLAPGAALDAGVPALLGRYGAGIVLAARPPAHTDRGDLAALVARCRDEGVAAALWPMLDDADGRWLNARNAARFSAYVRDLVDDLAARGLRPGEAVREVVLDLEPDFDDVSALLSGRGLRRLRGAPPRVPSARDALAALAAWLRARGIQATATVVPLVLFDAGGASAWQAVLGTPVDGLAWDHVNVMVYTSILEGWSRRTLRRADVRALLAAACRAAPGRFGCPASVSLGAVGVGALGDEPTYRAVAELADDVAVALACGVDDLALFDLGGVLARPPAEAWLEAFVLTAPATAVPPATARAGVALALGAAAGRAAALYTRRQ